MRSKKVLQNPGGKRRKRKFISEMGEGRGKRCHLPPPSELTSPKKYIQMKKKPCSKEKK